MRMKKSKYYIYSWPRRFDASTDDMSKSILGFDELDDAYDYATEMFRYADSSIFWCVAKSDKVAEKCLRQMIDECAEERLKQMIDEFGGPDASLARVHNSFREKLLKKFRNKEDGDFK